MCFELMVVSQNMASVLTTSNGVTLVYNGRRYYKNRTTPEKFTGVVVYEVVAHCCNLIYFRLTRTFESCLLGLTIIIQQAVLITISKKSNMEIKLLQNLRSI